MLVEDICCKFCVKGTWGGNFCFVTVLALDAVRLISLAKLN